MKGKHLHIESDSMLLVEIRKRVNEGLRLNQSSTKTKHWLKFIFYMGLCIFLLLRATLYQQQFLVVCP